MSVYCNVSTPSPLGDGQIMPIILETHDLKGSSQAPIP